MFSLKIILKCNWRLLWSESENYKNNHVLAVIFILKKENCQTSCHSEFSLWAFIFSSSTQILHLCTYQKYQILTEQNIVLLSLICSITDSSPCKTKTCKLCVCIRLNIAALSTVDFTTSSGCEIVTCCVSAAILKLRGCTNVKWAGEQNLEAVLGFFSNIQSGKISWWLDWL